MNNIKDILETFRHFLSCSWMYVHKYIESDTTGSFKEDWLQSNWEWLVEGQITEDREFWLEPYGDEADANPDSSRILYPHKIANHRIAVSSCSGGLVDALSGTPVPNDGLVFDKFVSLKDGWHIEAPPFDHVVLMCRDDSEHIVKFSDCRFDIQKI